MRASPSRPETTGWHVRILQAGASVYRFVIGPLLILSLPLFIAVAWKRRLPPINLAVGSLLLVPVATRIAMLGHIDATYFNFSIRLVAPVYGLALAFLWFGLCMARHADTDRAGSAPRDSEIE